jgi:hypothetical protein
MSSEVGASGMGVEEYNVARARREETAQSNRSAREAGSQMGVNIVHLIPGQETSERQGFKNLELSASRRHIAGRAHSTPLIPACGRAG